MSGINERVFAATSAFLMEKELDSVKPTSKTALSPNHTNRPKLPTKSLRDFYSRGDADHVAIALKTKQSESSRNNCVKGSSRILRFLLRVIVGGILGTVIFFALFYLASAPPMHWFYETGTVAGSGSVYLPGGGFSGFWFHLGYLQSFGDRHDLHDYDYYCFSAACLSILTAFLNHSLEEVYDTALASQDAWRSGDRSRFEIVDYFFEEIFPPEDDDNNDCFDKNGEELWWQDGRGGPQVSEVRKNSLLNNSDSRTCGRRNFLPRLKILVTSLSDERGYIVLESKDRNELKENILSTTWVPYLTGWGFRIPNLTEEPDGDSANEGNPLGYLDGAFSRTLHPRCEVAWNLPLIWETLVHSFSPGLSLEQVQSLWERGKKFEYEIPPVSRKTVALGTTNAAMDNALPSPRTANKTTTPAPSNSDDSIQGDEHCFPASAPT